MIGFPRRPFSGVFAAAAALLLLLAGGALIPQAARAQQQQGDLALDPGDTVTYEEAVRLALERNYQLRQTQNDVALQSISVDRNRAEFFPDLGFSAGGGRDFGRNFSQDQGQIISQSTDAARLSVGSNVNVFNGFRDDATLDAAQARTQAAGRTLQRRRQAVVFDVMSNYIQLAQDRALVGVREEQLELREQLLEQTEAQIEVGEKAPSAVYQLQADVAEARQQLLQAERNVDITQTELVRLLVLDPFGTYAFETAALEAGAESGVAGQEPAYQLGTLLSRAYEERDDLGAQRASINAEEQGVRAARAGFWPRLDLSANYGSNWNSLSQRPIEGTGTPAETVQLSPMGGGDPVEISVPGTGTPPRYSTTPFFDQLDARRGGGISFSISYPLFDRFQTRYNVEQAQVQLENTRFQEELLRQDIAVEMRQALIGYRNARTSLEVAAEQVEAARQAQEAAQERYRLGAATYVELAEANTTLAEAQSARVRAQYTLLLERRRLDYVQGTLEPEAPLIP